MTHNAAGPLRVLVTRPEPAASRTARHLCELGFDAVAAPLTEVRPLSPRMALDSGHRALATSANAFLGDPPPFFPFEKIRDFICVGEKTARAGVDWGLPDPSIVAPDAATLIERTREAGLHLSRWPIAYFAGSQRMPFLERAMDADGTHYRVFETYEAPALEKPFDNLDQSCVDVVLLMSPRAGNLFGQGWSRQHRPKLLCMSEAVRESLPVELQPHAAISDEPNFQSLLEALVALADQ
ncbi:MAG: uroporphyrinogen-III synthase [Pseudomonadota bacterium]